VQIGLSQPHLLMDWLLVEHTPMMLLYHMKYMLHQLQQLYMLLEQLPQLLLLAIPQLLGIITHNKSVQLV